MKIKNQLGNPNWQSLREQLAGELFTDLPTRKVYGTDASIYEELPAAVAVPREETDVRLLIEFAREFQVGLIPRTAGTSLAGQVVGSGIVVDVSRHFTNVIQINQAERFVKVQPGVIRDELNRQLSEHGLFFAPETSTSNRAMIGGMVGNNSCGSNSIVHGTTRDHLLEVSGYLGDGERVTFGPVALDEFNTRLADPQPDAESKIYQQIYSNLSPSDTKEKIRAAFPSPTIRRRNMGYAIDRLLEMEPFGGSEPFNLAKLIAGSEGTLFFATEIKLNCIPLVPQDSKLICAHFHSVADALSATQLAIQHQPQRCELIDSLVIEGAKRNLLQQQSLDFLQGEPAAVLLIELRVCSTGFSRYDTFPAKAGATNYVQSSQLAVTQRVQKLIEELEKSTAMYAAPVLTGPQAKAAWSLRKAGLGVVNNVVGTSKPTTVIEDAAVELADLPKFVADVDAMLAKKFQTHCVHYGHAGAGELHLRPQLDQADPDYPKTIQTLGEEFAKLVKQYRGSLSGEHGDGRLRSQFLPMMLGEDVYRLMKLVKTTFDPHNLLNPGKIVDPLPTDANLKQLPMSDSSQNSLFRFPGGQNLLGAASMCSGSGDCRKSHLAGGTMCPSYMATRNENDSTRARAHLLRQWLLDLTSKSKETINDHQVHEILRLCLSCKACKSECPSNVDMAKIKAEFTQAYFDKHGTPVKAKFLGSFETWCRRLGKLSSVVNLAASTSVTGRLLKRGLGIHPDRSLPKLASVTLRDWFYSRTKGGSAKARERRGRLFFFCDEFTNYIDVSSGQAAIELLELLGYEVVLPNHVESGRSAISAGLVKTARSIAKQNVRLLSEQLEVDDVLVGVEPSALLTLRDEYLDLVDPTLVEAAQQLSQQTLLIDDFLALQIDAGKINADDFHAAVEPVVIHGHCHQKALGTMENTRKVIQLATSGEVHVLATGCCGMAGSFGYEADKYELSMQIGELVLFPAVRSASADTIIIAAGTSCRHQIADGTGKTASHPAEFLRQRVKA